MCSVFGIMAILLCSQATLFQHILLTLCVVDHEIWDTGLSYNHVDFTSPLVSLTICRLIPDMQSLTTMGSFFLQDISSQLISVPSQCVVITWWAGRDQKQRFVIKKKKKKIWIELKQFVMRRTISLPVIWIQTLYKIFCVWGGLELSMRCFLICMFVFSLSQTWFCLYSALL